MKWQQMVFFPGIWNWFKRHLDPVDPSDPVYNNKKKKRKRRRRHHRFCMKCVTSSFKSLFRVLKIPVHHNLDIHHENELNNNNNGQNELVPGISSGANNDNKDQSEFNKNDPLGLKRAHSRTATEVTRTPTPKMLLDMTSGAIHWPVYQMGGQSGSGMLLSTKGLVKSKVKSAGIKEEPGRENFSLGM